MKRIVLFILVCTILLVACEAPIKQEDIHPTDSNTTEGTPLSFTPQKITTLPYIEFNEKWKSIGSRNVNNISGIDVILLNYYKANDEVKLILQDRHGFVDLDMPIENIEEVQLLAEDVNNDGGNELIVKVNMGATYQAVRVYDYYGENWRCILDTHNLTSMDMDNDGQKELATTSMGSLPPYLYLYKWDGSNFLASDVAKDIGGIYAVIEKQEGKNLIQAGDAENHKLYRYIDGRLYEVKDNER